MDQTNDDDGAPSAFTDGDPATISDLRRIMELEVLFWTCV